MQDIIYLQELVKTGGKNKYMGKFLKNLINRIDFVYLRDICIKSINIDTIKDDLSSMYE
jgi:hypothetical protein